MGKFYNVYRMQVDPEVTKLVQVAERESILEAYGHILDDECELHGCAADIQTFESDEMIARDFFDSEKVLIGCDRVLKGEHLSTAIVEDYLNDTKVVYLMEEVD